MMRFRAMQDRRGHNAVTPGKEQRAEVDFIVVGGGIVGLSTAMHLLEQRPGASLLLLEKESALAAHQTSHNSGVIHSGIYYPPHTLKARFCRDGVQRTIDFCRRHGVAFEQCGKLLVATGPLEQQRMEAIHARCRNNGFDDIALLGPGELGALEPQVTGTGALHVPRTGIVCYADVARAMACVITTRGGTIRTASPVRAIRENRSGVTVELDDGTIRGRYLVACAGLMADRVARMCRLDFNFRIIPFRGEFYRLPAEKSDLVQRLIYPIPDPALPFLGVHLTRTMDGGLIVGPNAVLALKREGYNKGAFHVPDVADMVGYPGFWRFVSAHLKAGLKEYWHAMSPHRYVQLCRKYCPDLTAEDLQPHPSGVRAQAVLPDGTFADDFVILNTVRTLHVCNAPSPAATSSIPIGRYLVSAVNARLELGDRPLPAAS